MDEVVQGRSDVDWSVYLRIGRRAGRRDLGWTALSDSFWRKAVRHGWVPYHRVGRAILLRRADVEEFIAQGRQSAKAAS